MNEVDGRPAFRFGRTIVSVAVGDLLGQEAEVIVVAANRRGVLGPLATPGLSGLRSLGGSEIEREAMSLAPLDLGTAVVTGASGLEERGIRAVVHAVVHPALGERARIEDVRRAVPAALTAVSKSPCGPWPCRSWESSRWRRRRMSTPWLRRSSMSSSAACAAPSPDSTG